MERDPNADEVKRPIHGRATQLVEEMRQQAEEMGEMLMHIRVDAKTYAALARELHPIAPEVYYFPMPVYVVADVEPQEVGPH